MTRLVKFFVLVVLPLAGQPQSKLTVPVTVCELLSHREDYANRLVTVRGQVTEGPHGAYFTAGPECHFKLVTKGVTWRNLIYLSSPNNKSVDPAAHADFEVDLDAEAKIMTDIRRLNFNPKTDTLVETVVGLCRILEDLDHRVNPSLPDGGFLRTLGFGPGLDAPVELLIETRRDPAVLHRDGR